MIPVQNMKFVTLLQPETKNNGDFTNNTYADTQGWNHLRVLFITGVITASAPIGSTAEGTAPLVEECDTVGGSYTAVTGAALADAIADDEDNKRSQALHAGPGAALRRWHAGSIPLYSRLPVAWQHQSEERRRSRPRRTRNGMIVVKDC